MHNPFFPVLLVLLIICGAAPVARADGATVTPLYTLDATSSDVRNAVLPAGARWIHGPDDINAILSVTVLPQEKDSSRMVAIPIDLRPWRGSRIRLVCEIKAENVSVPARSYNGIKCQLQWVSPENGARWFDKGGLSGTFDWSEIFCPIVVDDDATTGFLNLGMQESSGTALIRNVRIIPVQMKPQRPPFVAEDFLIYKGHDLPRLRGVMSPKEFVRKDFSDLKGLNVNLIRWQLLNGIWGQANTDLDLEVYDRWIDAKLDETQKVLDAAQEDGIKIVIDMHSPPGGRLKDRTLRLVMEAKYQDHFVKVWEKIARRFAGHPALWAYDLINEPVQMRPSPEGVLDYVGAQVRAARAIRVIDPTTAISITCDQWSAPDAFAYFTPVDVPNVIYQVHMYWPGEFTHQGVFNAWGVEKGDAPLSYPGTLNKKTLDKEALRRRLEPVREFQRAYGVHIYVGEFGTIRWSPGGARYLEDCIELFEEYGWDWSYHAFREWPGWSFEYEDLPYSMEKHTKAQTPTDREKALRKWFNQNLHPQP